MRSIAIEAVYDTSREVLPHEIFWEALQTAFAKNGRLLVTDAKRADGLVRAHITAGYIQPAGTPERETGDKDPKITRSEKPRPEEFRNLTRSGSWTTTESLGFTVTIELWDLRTRKMISQKHYTGAGSYKSVLAETGSSGVQKSMQYLIYEESLQTQFKKISQQIADKAVSDVFL